MNHYVRSVLFTTALAVAFFAACLAWYHTSSAAPPEAGTVIDAGTDGLSAPPPLLSTMPPTSLVAPVPLASEQVVDPIEHPQEAVDQITNARRNGWPVAMLLVLLMVFHAVSYLAAQHPEWTFLAPIRSGPVASWLAIGLTMTAAMFDALVHGGTWLAVGAAGLASVFVLDKTSARPGPPKGMPDGAVVLPAGTVVTHTSGAQFTTTTETRATPLSAPSGGAL